MDIFNTFFPGQQIEDPKWFAGRKFDIEKALKCLCSPGSSILVFGERGVGKSSFVEMVKKIAEGNLHLVYKYEWQKIYQPEKFKFKVIQIECDSEANTTAKVLQRLITSPLGIKSIISSRIDKIESNIRDKGTIELLRLISFSEESERKIISESFKEDNIFEMFTNLIHTISRDVLKPSEGLLIAIDEFDLVEDSSKMASLIKTLSKNNVKFLISGVAETYEELLAGHSSVHRQLLYGRIHITPMNYNEVEDLFKIVTENSQKKIRFEPGFIKEVFSKSKGYPYFVQLFGQLSLDSYIKLKGIQPPYIIHNLFLQNGIKELGMYELSMEKSYLSIIKENPLKEFILRYIAKTVYRKIPDEEVYAYCFKNGIVQPQPKNIVASLLGHRDPQFIIREQEESDYFYFINPLFKIYANTREPELLKLQDGQYTIP